MNPDGSYLICKWQEAIFDDSIGVNYKAVQNNLYPASPPFRTITHEVWLYAWNRGNAFLGCTCPEHSGQTPDSRVRSSCPHTRKAEERYLDAIVGILNNHEVMLLTNATITELKNYKPPARIFGYPVEPKLEPNKEPVLTKDKIDAMLYGVKGTTSIKEQKQADQEANLLAISRSFSTLERRLREQGISDEIIDKVKQVALNLGKQGTLARNIEIVVDKLDNVKIRAKDNNGQVIYTYDTRSDYDQRRTVFMDMVIDDPFDSELQPAKPASTADDDKKDRFDYLEL